MHRFISFNIFMKNSVRVLSEKEIQKKLKELPGWEFLNNKINKEYTFDSFRSATKFLPKLGSFCDKIDHHPDIFFHYNKIKFELSTKDLGEKITNKDFLVAKKIEKIYSKLYE